MDNSVDTNVLEGNTAACSSTQVMNLGAVVPTDPTTCTTVSMLSGYTTCPGSLAKPVGGAVLDDKIYLLTNKPYLLNELRFGYAYLETCTEEIIKEITDETTGETTTCTTTVSSTNTNFVKYNSSPCINQYGLYDFRNIGTTLCSNVKNLQICGYDNLDIRTINVHISSCNCIYIGCCTYDQLPDAELISCVSYTNYINMYSDYITVGAPVLDRVYYEKCTEDNWELDVSSEKFGTKTIELQAMDSISIGCSPILLTKPCADFVTKDNAFDYYSNYGDYHYVSSLNLFGKWTYIYGSESISLSSINCGSYINIVGGEYAHDSYLDIQSYCISICANSNLTLYGGCVYLGITGSEFLISNWDSVTLGNISGGSTCIQGSTVKINLPEKAGCTKSVVVLEGYNYDNEPSLSINTDLYDSGTRKGTYEVTKGISTMPDETGIPDLVNRIFKYSGTVTSFSAKPKYTDVMKDNVLYEYEVWHTIPDASGITYTSPIDVEWLYGDPAESGIELTDGITLYYAFRAFKADGAVRVQGNLYATTTPQTTTQE